MNMLGTIVALEPDEGEQRKLLAQAKYPSGYIVLWYRPAIPPMRRFLLDPAHNVAVIRKAESEFLATAEWLERRIPDEPDSKARFKMKRELDNALKCADAVVRFYGLFLSHDLDRYSYYSGGRIAAPINGIVAEEKTLRVLVASTSPQGRSTGSLTLRLDHRWKDPVRGRAMLHSAAALRRATCAQRDIFDHPSGKLCFVLDIPFGTLVAAPTDTSELDEQADVTASKITLLWKDIRRSNYAQPAAG